MAQTSSISLLLVMTLEAIRRRRETGGRSCKASAAQGLGPVPPHHSRLLLLVLCNVIVSKRGKCIAPGRHGGEHGGGALVPACVAWRMGALGMPRLAWRHDGAMAAQVGEGVAGGGGRDRGGNWQQLAAMKLMCGECSPHLTWSPVTLSSPLPPSSVLLLLPALPTEQKKRRRRSGARPVRTTLHALDPRGTAATTTMLPSPPCHARPLLHPLRPSHASPSRDTAGTAQQQQCSRVVHN